MSKGIFITGTGTDVGKTFVSALIVKKLREDGIRVAYYKAAMSGNERDSEGKLVPGDAKYVKDVSGIEEQLFEMCPYVYENAVSPHLASKLEDNPVSLENVKQGYARLCEKYDFILVEGSGGIMCPIRYDDSKIMLEDVIKELELESIIVADAGLGTINSVVLTWYYMKSHNLPVKGIIFNNYHKGNVMEEDNIKMCEELTGLKTLAMVEENGEKINDLVSLSANEKNE